MNWLLHSPRYALLLFSVAMLSQFLRSRNLFEVCCSSAAETVFVSAFPIANLTSLFLVSHNLREELALNY